MAKLESDFQFTGPMGNISAYRMRGVDKIVVRKKGGATKKRIKNDPRFEKTRQNNAEFAGRAMGVRYMMKALRPLKNVRDYNIAGDINRLMKYVQDRDEVNDTGKRTVQLSRHGFLLEGFSLNRMSTFENVIKVPLTYSISKETLTARVDIPELLPGINFSPSQKHPLFSVMAVLGVIPDLYWTKDGYTFSNENRKSYQPGYSASWLAESSTPWLHVTEGLPASTLELKVTDVPPDNNFALMLTVGIRMGTPLAKMVDEVKYAGCGKVVRVV